MSLRPYWRYAAGAIPIARAGLSYWMFKKQAAARARVNKLNGFRAARDHVLRRPRKPLSGWTMKRRSFKKKNTGRSRIPKGKAAKNKAPRYNRIGMGFPPTMRGIHLINHNPDMAAWGSNVNHWGRIYYCDKMFENNDGITSLQDSNYYPLGMPTKLKLYDHFMVHANKFKIFISHKQAFKLHVFFAWVNANDYSEMVDHPPDFQDLMLQKGWSHRCVEPYNANADIAPKKITIKTYARRKDVNADLKLPKSYWMRTPVWSTAGAGQPDFISNDTFVKSDNESHWFLVLYAYFVNFDGSKPGEITVDGDSFNLQYQRKLYVKYYSLTNEDDQSKPLDEESMTYPSMNIVAPTAHNDEIEAHTT